jgi:uncharacterized membrane protein
VNAASLQYYVIEDFIHEDLSVHNIITLKFASPISRLEYQLDFKIYNLTVTSNFDLADCDIIDMDGRSRILCNFIGMTTEKNLLKLEFDTKSGIKKIGEKYQFTVNYGISLPINRAFILIRLPKNGILAEDIANQSYFPSYGKTLTDGKHIMVYWEMENLTSGDNLQFSVLYKMPVMIDYFLLISLTFIVLVVMIGLTMYAKRKPKPMEITSVLNKDEKIIVDLLAKHKDKVIQKVLVRESDFSKAKVSRLVKNLKERGVIDVEPIGRTNKISLKIKGLKPSGNS